MKSFLTILLLFFASLTMSAQTKILGIEFGSGYDDVYNSLVSRCGEASVQKLDGEHIMVKNYDYTINDVKISSITFTFSFIDGKHFLESIAFVSAPMVLSAETQQEKIKDFNSYAVTSCNSIAKELNEKYAVQSVEKKIDVTKKWTVLYNFKVDENVVGVISAYFSATKKLMLQSGSTFARLKYTDRRYSKKVLDEL